MNIKKRWRYANTLFHLPWEKSQWWKMECLSIPFLNLCPAQQTFNESPSSVIWRHPFPWSWLYPNHPFNKLTDLVMSLVFFSTNIALNYIHEFHFVSSMSYSLPIKRAMFSFVLRTQFPFPSVKAERMIALAKRRYP